MRVRVDPPALCFVPAHVRQSVEQGVEPDAQLHPREMYAEALMHALPKCDVPNFRTINVERIRIVDEISETGHAFAQRCRHMVEDRDDAFAAVSEHGAPQGTLRITCSIAFGERYVAPVVRRFVEENPNVQTVLQLDNRVLDLIAEGYDLAIRTGELSDSRMIATRIASRHRHLCASPDYLARRGEPKNLSDLANHEALIGTRDLWTFAVDGEIVDMRPKGRWRCNSGFAVVDAAVAGLGICQLPDFYVRDQLETGGLIDLLAHLEAPPEPVWAVYPHRHHLQPKVRLFIDRLRSALVEACVAGQGVQEELTSLPAA